MAGSSRQERAWVQGARDGSAADLEALFREHWPRAYRAAYLVVHDAAAAEDVAQEAFLAALRALDRFDRRRPFGPWLHRIVVNRAIDWARARSLRGEVFAEGLVEVAAPAVEVPTSRAPYEDKTLAALGDLSPEHRAVIVLRYLLEYTPGEIAELLELPRGTVNSRLRRGLDKLGGRLDEEDR
jgi:RNA polymerase sigma-70 factor, ECF subfamily